MTGAGESGAVAGAESAGVMDGKLAGESVAWERGVRVREKVARRRGVRVVVRRRRSRDIEEERGVVRRREER